jgi:membrane protein YdbS with pleckstrin-like domain
MSIFCQQCGTNLMPESAFCNRCGAKAPNKSGKSGSGQSVVAPRRAGRPAPPRPARRAPVTPAPDEAYDEDYGEEYQEDYPDRGDENYRQDPPGKDDVIFSISPTFYEVMPSYVLAVVLSLIVTVGVAYAQGPLFVSLIAAAIFFIRPIFRHWRLKHTVYTLTGAKLEIRTGILSKDARSIPLRHIDNVEVSETLRERLMGIGDVLIDSPALDSKMVLENINNPRKYADLIMEQLQYFN